MCRSHRVSWGPLALVLVAFSFSCAQGRRQVDGTSRATAISTPQSTGFVTTERASSHVDENAPDFAHGCLTLRDVAEADLVQMNGPWLYYADESSGLWIADVSDPDRPRVASHVPHVGSPLYLFVRDGIAWVIFVDWDHRWSRNSVATTVIRAIDVRDAEHPAIVGEAARYGVATDARLVGGLLYALRDQDKGAIVESFGIARTSVRPLGQVELEGQAVELAASSAGLAAITKISDTPSVTWLDLPAHAPGAIEARDPVRLTGSIPERRVENARIADADDGGTVHVVTCETATCSDRDGSRLHVVDFAATPPRVAPSVPLARRGGLPVTRFIDDRLYAASRDEEALTSAAGGFSELRVVELYPSPHPSGKVRVRGMVRTLVPRGDSIVVLGQLASTEGRGRLVVHDVDVRRANAPRLRGTATFGSDWTWSVAEDDARGMSFDPTSRLAAIPFTLFRESDSRYGIGTQLIDLGSKGTRVGPAFSSDELVDRAIFLSGRLLTIGIGGIDVIDLRESIPETQETAPRRQ